MRSAFSRHHRKQTPWTLLLGALFVLGAPPATFAQQSEIDALASRVAQRITASGKKRVVLLDFHAVNGKIVPLGVWLADQFSAALAKAAPNLDIIDRAQHKAILDASQPSLDGRFDQKTEDVLCKSVGAEIAVPGSIGPAERAVGITLPPFDVCNPSHPKKIEPTNGKVPLSKEMEALLPDGETLLLPGGLWQSGAGGATEPTCVHCPSPPFSDEAVRRNKEGIVRLEVVVTPEGRATNVRITKGAGYDMDEKAVEFVQQWKLKPAIGPDGNPVPARVLVEVSFRLLRNP